MGEGGQVFGLIMISVVNFQRVFEGLTDLGRSGVQRPDFNRQITGPSQTVVQSGLDRNGIDHRNIGPRSVGKHTHNATISLSGDGR